MMGSSLLTARDSELGLANVLVDDVADAELLLLLHPYQLHTLMDKDVLLLARKTETCFSARTFSTNTRKDNMLMLQQR